MTNEQCLIFKSILNGCSHGRGESANVSMEDLVLNMVLPLSMAGSMIVYSQEKDQAVRPLVANDRAFNNITEIVTGSSADGLALPQVTNIKGDKFNVEGPDENVNYVFSALIVDQNKKRAFARTESQQSPAGFTRLHFNENWHDKRTSKFPAERLQNNIVLDSRTYLDNEGYILRSKLVWCLRTSLHLFVHNQEKELKEFRCRVGSVPKIRFSHHGPAITVDREDTVLRIIVSTDYVVSLPCPRWPEEASEWFKRKRVWPEQDIVTTIIKGGCHIVPKTHKLGNDPREFIFSFSVCEKILAHSLSTNQKRCYMLLKFLFKYNLDKVKRGLTTYYCKMTLFWLCERIPLSKWREDNPLECLMWLLSDLKGYLQVHHLPNYFIPKRNMIDHLSTASVQACLRDIENVLKDPLSIILELTENHRFCWFSRDVSLKKMLQPLLSEGIYTQNMPRMYVLQYLSVMLDKGEIYLALSMICGTESCEVLPETEYSIQCLENVLEQCDEGDDIVCVKGLLANIYHQRAEECVKSGNKRYGEKYKRISLQTYQEILQDVGHHIWIYSAYYDLLYACGSCHILLRHFLSVVHPQAKGKHSVLFTSGMYTAITPHSFLTVHPSIFNFTEESVIPSTAYILFKVILAYSKTDVNVNALESEHNLMIHWREAISLLEKWVVYKCQLFPEKNDDFMLYLVGMTRMMAGDINKGCDHFQAAVEYTSSFSKIEFGMTNVKEEVPTLETQSKRRYHPYRQSKNFHQKQKLHNANKLFSELRFRNGEFHIKPYIHY
ncbi:hypothetical protein CHS0354_023181 [Potamilus streckersoni]|uniref:Mab-21-like HhH/H2TH-like domain-containing protein n=1 Tax=Potamilus streckersoni TaxID=2493646 RepID=A0AAE0SK26_9BIVA|nr:hypothetical protein CHS0354_023181 [Potamilus streckersoni]